MPGFKQTILNQFNLGLRFILKMSGTRTNYWGEFAVDIPLGLALITLSLRRHDLYPPAVILTVAAGLFLFSFFEYLVHRWLFHGSVRVMAEGHRAHHENPMGYDALPFFLPAMVILALTGVYVLLMPPNYALLLTGTITFGYVTYGLSHFAVHHVHFHRSRARRWAAHHLIHHYHPGNNFGVTTPMWDILLGTRYAYIRKQ